MKPLLIGAVPGLEAHDAGGSAQIGNAILFGEVSNPEDVNQIFAQLLKAIGSPGKAEAKLELWLVLCIWLMSGDGPN